ncbi:MAG: glycoside hydrolase family 95 protein, partial [Clostridia bacterium]|nr:glycoside hydrolase family 95 protein [Clostridia bacterium]
VREEGGRLILSGELEYYGIQYEAIVSVKISGGELILHEKTIEVKNADSAVVLLAVGTNYKMESRVFLERDPKKKLAPYPHPHELVSAIMAEAEKREYGELLVRHIRDYGALFTRAGVDFGGEMPNMTTDKLIEAYRAQGESKHCRYLEELYFAYGRYLLIASSRPGTYPANLQGTWTKYASSPWSAGYWHNINVQMNYWPAFNTNLHELFLPYVEYFKAYRALAEENTDQYTERNFPDNYTAPGTNGISVGTAAWLYNVTGISEPGEGHSGPGTSAFTAKLFADYYDFSLDDAHLRDAVYPANRGVALFLSKTLEEQDDGTLLVKYSESPEQRHNGEYYHTKGCAFDQQMVYECYKDTLRLAENMGVSDEFTEKIRADIEKLDPVQIGASGQIKEYREEVNYGDIGEYNHRHISHLVGLYPGTTINGNKREWIAAAQKTLTERGDVSTGWSTAHKLNAWARTKNGERAHDLLRILLGECTMPNLWDSHPPFQIDGNFGGTAGIAEMLLQSHEGYIHILPALPAEWANGSFTGLSARGGFTVSAKWFGGKVSEVSVTAKRAGKIKMLISGSGKFIEREMAAGQTVLFDIRGKNTVEI